MVVVDRICVLLSAAASGLQPIGSTGRAQSSTAGQADGGREGTRPSTYI